MSDFRTAYKKYSGKIKELLREPTDADISAMMPVDHPYELENFTVGQWLDFRKDLWQAKQVSAIVRMLMEAEA